MTKNVVFIGAAGEMCRLAIRRFAVAHPGCALTLCDIRPELLQSLARDLPNTVHIRKLDLFKPANLREVITGAESGRAGGRALYPHLGPGDRGLH